MEEVVDSWTAAFLRLVLLLPRHPEVAKASPEMCASACELLCSFHVASSCILRVVEGVTRTLLNCTLLKHAECAVSAVLHVMFIDN